MTFRLATNFCIRSVHTPGADLPSQGTAPARAAPCRLVLCPSGRAYATRPKRARVPPRTRDRVKGLAARTGQHVVILRGAVRTTPTIPACAALAVGPLVPPGSACPSIPSRPGRAFSTARNATIRPRAILPLLSDPLRSRPRTRSTTAFDTPSFTASPAPRHARLSGFAAPSN